MTKEVTLSYRHLFVKCSIRGRFFPSWAAGAAKMSFCFCFLKFLPLTGGSSITDDSAAWRSVVGLVLFHNGGLTFHTSVDSMWLFIHSNELCFSFLWEPEKDGKKTKERNSNPCYSTLWETLEKESRNERNDTGKQVERFELRPRWLFWRGFSSVCSVGRPAVRVWLLFQQ